MPRETIGINISTLPVYEAGAVFLACVAHPDDQEERKKFYMALCRQTIIQMANQDGDWAWQPQSIKPGFFVIGDQTAEKALKKGFKLLNKRIIAGHWYFLPFAQKQFIDPDLRPEGLEVNVSNMATLAAQDFQKSTKKLESTDQEGSRNVMSRMFTPSRPVIHAAAALATLSQAVHRKFAQRGETLALSLLLHEQSVLSGVVQRAEEFRQLLGCMEKPAIAEADTIQFRLA